MSHKLSVHPHSSHMSPFRTCKPTIRNSRFDYTVRIWDVSFGASCLHILRVWNLDHFSHPTQRGVESQTKC